jgi:hypothetical protein
MTETGERCPDCDRPLFEGGYQAFEKHSRAIQLAVCAAGKHSAQGDSDCTELTITRLRAELATLRQSIEHSAKLTEAERGLVDAARRYSLTRSDADGVLLLKMAERLNAKDKANADR